MATIAVIGVTLGCFAALRGVGFSIVYGVLGEANLAYGDAMVLAVFAAAGIHDRTKSIALSMAIAAALAGALLVATDLLLLRPLRGRGDALSPIMVTIGLALILRNVATQTQGVEDRGIAPFFGSATREVANTSVDVPLAIAAVLLLAVSVGGALMLRSTSWGHAVRATRLDALGARVTGIPVGRLVTILYGVAGSIGGLTGLLVASHVGVATVGDGFQFTLIAFAAAAFGGGRSIGWAVGGGLLLGMAAAVVQFHIGLVWTQAAYLAVLVPLLIVRPRGLARIPAGDRV